MKYRQLFLFVASVLSVIVVSAQDYHVRFAFIGNSITYGAGVSNPSKDSYPAQLGVMLKGIYGDTCTISNYAVSGRTLLKHGDFPIWNEPGFTTAWKSAPDIVFISLGTNDSKPYNWDDYKDEFFTDYKSMIDTFLVRNPWTKFIVCLPPPAFAVVWDIRNPVIVNEVIPLIDSISKVTGAELIDFYTPLLDSVALFPDKIHPGVAGSAAMAKIAFEKILSSDIVHKVEKGHSFVTGLTSNVPTELRIGDAAKLSWTSINATEAFFNGQKVDLNGNITVSPTVDTKYVLKVSGEFNSDSLVLLQKTYIPALARMGASASQLTMFPGDTSKIKMRFYDQKNKLILDSVFSLSYSVIEGYGKLLNQGDNYIEFIPDSAGKARIECKSSGIIYDLSITVKSFPVSVDLKDAGNAFQICPNPFNRELFIKMPVNKPGQVEISIFDASGRLCLKENHKTESRGIHEIKVTAPELNKGLYILRVRSGSSTYTQKLFKE
jgi:acyl-CoA thioesterase I